MMLLAKVIEIIKEDKLPLELAAWIASEHNEEKSWEIISHIRQHYQDYIPKVELKDHEQILKQIEALRLYGYVNMPNKMYLNMLYGENDDNS